MPDRRVRRGAQVCGAHERVDEFDLDAPRPRTVRGFDDGDGELAVQRLARHEQVVTAPDRQPDLHDCVRVAREVFLPQETFHLALEANGCGPWSSTGLDGSCPFGTYRCRAPDAASSLLRVRACGVCRTDLHIVDGELDRPKLPLVPGHQIVGEAEDGRRLGVPWLGWTCGECRYCTSGRENLCDRARFTGYDLDGGYAEWVVADERFCFPIPDGFGDLQAAPLLCAGLIGYRSLRLARRRRAARALRVRRRGTHRRAGRAP